MSSWMGRRTLRVAVCAAAVVLLTAGAATADEKLLLELKAQLEQQRKEIDELKKKLGGAGPYKAADPEKEKVNKLIDTYLADKEKKKKDADDKKAKEREEEGYEVGKQLDLKGKWISNQYWFETEDKAFRLHVGGRTQIDAVWVHAPKNVTAPLGQFGIGEFDDAVNFRRARLAIEGTFWEVFDFNCEYDFLNAFRFVPGGNVNRVADAAGNRTLDNLAGTVADRRNIANTPVPTDLWIQWRQIPVVQTVRAGNHKPWFAFEHATSSRFLDWLERSYAFDAFVENGNNGFSPGVSIIQHYADDRLNVAAGVFKANTVDIFGWDTGDGEYQFAGRVWGTPVYEDGGRCLVHLGLGFTHRGADDGIVRYRARTALRNGNAVSHNIIALIQAQAHNESILVPEVAVNYGPFNVSAEYYAVWADQRGGEVFQNVGNAGINAATGAPLPAALARGRGGLFYHGAYVTVGYFLTGEHRSYSQKGGAWDRQAVNEGAWVVEGEDGLSLGRGAVELLARYQYLDLDSRSVNGGIVHGMTLGVNWFLNPNAKLQLNYELGYRDVTEYAAGRLVRDGNGRDGIFQGVGTRFAFDW